MPEPDPVMIDRAGVYANLASFYLDDSEGDTVAPGRAIEEMRRALAILGAAPDPGVRRRLQMSLDAFGRSVSAPVATDDIRAILDLLGPPAPEGEE
jgi:hypothetical protein